MNATKNLHNSNIERQFGYSYPQIALFCMYPVEQDFTESSRGFPNNKIYISASEAFLLEKKKNQQQNSISREDWTGERYHFL